LGTASEVTTLLRYRNVCIIIIIIIIINTISYKPLWKFYQIYNLDATGNKDELIRF